MRLVMVLEVEYENRKIKSDQSERNDTLGLYRWALKLSQSA